MLKIKMGMGFENCEVEFEKQMNWEMGLVPTPFQGLDCYLDVTKLSVMYTKHCLLKERIGSIHKVPVKRIWWSVLQ